MWSTRAPENSYHCCAKLGLPKATKQGNQQQTYQRSVQILDRQLVDPPRGVNSPNVTCEVKLESGLVGAVGALEGLLPRVGEEMPVQGALGGEPSPAQGAGKRPLLNHSRDLEGRGKGADRTLLTGEQGARGASARLKV